MPETDTPTPPANTSTPPWGDDFDADRAWTLLQNVRADLAKAKDDLTVERQARSQAEADLAASDPKGKVADAEARVKEAERALFVERALRKHPDLDESLVEFLSGETEDEILSKAERLAGIGKPKEEKPAGKPEGDPEKPETGGETPPADEGLPGKPSPQLTPGHGGTPPTPFDPDAIVAKVRSGIR